MPEMKCFERSSPALREILLKLYRAEKPMAVDHHWYEFGCVEYHIQSSASDAKISHLSILTPQLCKRLPLKYELRHCTKEMKKAMALNVVEIIEPARQGYQLTLRIDLAKLQRRKGAVKMITAISSVQAMILSYQLKEILMTASPEDVSEGIRRPIKLTYHPGEPFFVVKQPAKITTVFPMRFKEETDVIIATDFFQVEILSWMNRSLLRPQTIELVCFKAAANEPNKPYLVNIQEFVFNKIAVTAFFQELIDVRSLKQYATVPACTWSLIPPPELRGEHLQDLSTNGGFIMFDISSRHIEGKRLDKTVWCLLNFFTFVKYHVKCTRGYIQRRMRNRLENLVTVMKTDNEVQDEDVEKIRGCGCLPKLVRTPNSPKIRRGSGFADKIRRITSKIKIRGLSRFRRRWLPIPKFSSTMKYRKLE